MSRIYLDYNATAPLRREAREAVLAALDIGNPSSVHEAVSYTHLTLPTNREV